MDSKISSFRKRSWGENGQITIFIIIGLILVVLIALIFVIRNPPNVKVLDEKAPHSYIETCAKEALEKGLDEIEKHGGDIEPNLSVMYQSINRSYLCYTTQYYKPCVNQRPKLIEYIESQLTSYLTPKVAECFNSLKISLEKRYNVEMGEMQIKTKLAPGEVAVEIKRKFKMSREDETRDFDSFNIMLIHPVYNLAEISSEITNQEARFCGFDTLGYMTIYPEYDITKFRTGDSDKIYSVKDRKSGEDFNFAIRSCVLPVGV